MSAHNHPSSREKVFCVDLPENKRIRDSTSSVNRSFTEQTELDFISSPGLLLRLYNFWGGRRLESLRNPINSDGSVCLNLLSLQYDLGATEFGMIMFHLFPQGWDTLWKRLLHPYACLQSIKSSAYHHSPRLCLLHFRCLLGAPEVAWTLIWKYSHYSFSKSRHMDECEQGA